MKHKRKKTLKTIAFISIITVIVAIFTSVCYLSISFASGNYVSFDINKITDYSLNIPIYDFKLKKISDSYSLSGNEFIKLEELPKFVPQCFISIEDKKFYSHNGIDYKRMVAATIKNITTLKFNQGASTISQQLIKNTHLTNKKTLKRKLNEIFLTKKLEKALSKDDILEYYLNVIYFGDNCYGIESASKHYFSKSAKDLEIDEAATLSGIIKSPNKYHPVKNTEVCKKRRNLVLSEMYKDGNINKPDYDSLIKKPLTITLSSKQPSTNSYANAAISEACKILKMPAKQIAIANYSIYTYQDSNKQSAILDSAALIENDDYQIISINPYSGGVEAYIGNGDIMLLNIKRQPASCIKPVLVYGPSLNDNIISPQTQILDEQININGYCPKNVGQKYYGYISAKTALAKSLNIPAIKTMTYTGIDRCQYYAKKCGIEFSEQDNNLSIALGGLSDGVTLKTLTNAYIPFVNNGYYKKSSFVSKILDENGFPIYVNNSLQTKVFRDDTAYLITDMLKESTKSGTAKVLADCEYDVASKTGTNTVSGKNIDAYNVSYTTNDLIGVWIGNIDNSETLCVGGGLPSRITKEYFKKIYKDKKPEQFKMPNSCVYVDIDTQELKENHLVVQANKFSPDRYRQKALFSKFNLPKEPSNKNISIVCPTINGKCNNGNITINFIGNELCTYELRKIVNGKDMFVEELSNCNGYTTYSFPYESTKNSIKVYMICKVTNYETNTEFERLKSNELSFINIKK